MENNNEAGTKRLRTLFFQIVALIIRRGLEEWGVSEMEGEVAASPRRWGERWDALQSLPHHASAATPDSAEAEATFLMPPGHKKAPIPAGMGAL
ncbi:MAG: hypothetical protein JWO08_2020 [Verrucomicrobiaceae bacterium]|nr:hypothetical protein [Verrucomicrobiaceae bacterium]